MILIFFKVGKSKYKRFTNEDSDDDEDDEKDDEKEENSRTFATSFPTSGYGSVSHSGASQQGTKPYLSMFLFVSLSFFRYFLIVLVPDVILFFFFQICVTLFLLLKTRCRLINDYEINAGVLES